MDGFPSNSHHHVARNECNEIGVQNTERFCCCFHSALCRRLDQLSALAVAMPLMCSRRKTLCKQEPPISKVFCGHAAVRWPTSGHSEHQEGITITPTTLSVPTLPDGGQFSLRLVRSLCQPDSIVDVMFFRPRNDFPRFVYCWFPVRLVVLIRSRSSFLTRDAMAGPPS